MEDFTDTLQQVLISMLLLLIVKMRRFIVGLLYTSPNVKKNQITWVVLLLII